MIGFGRMGCECTRSAPSDIGTEGLTRACENFVIGRRLPGWPNLPALIDDFLTSIRPDLRRGMKNAMKCVAERTGVGGGTRKGSLWGPRRRWPAAYCGQGGLQIDRIHATGDDRRSLSPPRSPANIRRDRG